MIRIGTFKTTWTGIGSVYIISPNLTFIENWDLDPCLKIQNAAKHRHACRIVDQPVEEVEKVPEGNGMEVRQLRVC